VAEARGDDQAERRDAALQQRVGGNRGAMRETGDVRRAGAACARMSLTPRTRPIAGLDGVLDTFVTDIAPVVASTATMSVKVPPVSMPMRNRGED
jgi:hypothetical protein